MFKTLRRAAYLVGREKRSRWILLVVLAVVVTGLEAVAAVLVYVLIGLVTRADDALTLPVVGDLGTALGGVDQERLLLPMAGFITVFFLMRGAVRILQGYAESRVLENAGAALSVRLLRGYLAMPYDFHVRRNSAEMIRNAYDTATNVTRDVFATGLKLVTEGLLVVGVLAVLVATAPLATLFAVGTLGPILYVILRVVHPRLKSYGRSSQEMSRETMQALQQSLEGVRDIKVAGREAFFGRDYARSRAALARSSYLRGALIRLPQVLMETALVLFIVGFFSVAVALGGSALGALPVLGLFAYAAMRLKPSLNAITSSLNAIKFTAVAVDQLYEDLQIISVTEKSRKSETGTAKLPFEHSIVFDDVCFRYDEAADDVLRHVSFSIRRGESIGIVGPTGGGKSTLIDLLLGLLEPTSGSVRVGGVDIRDHVRAWQANLGVVPQSLFLIDDTLRRNVALGVKDQEIDEERLRESVRMAQLEDCVADLPDGLDTRIGERGVRLSGGQRQRVAIARALYRRPTVLVFDEGTSALDNQTETQLMQALTGLRGQHTLVAVAHRLTTVRGCDRILVVDSGRIVASGSYEELAAGDALFQRLITSGTMTPPDLEGDGGSSPIANGTSSRPRL